MSEAKMKGLNTPYDSAFKSIIQKCPRLALFLINEMFYRNRLIPEKYDGTEHVTLLNRELTDLEFGNLEEDIRLKVGTGERGVFHMECESTAGGTRVMLRMVRYDTRTAMEDAEVTDDCIRLRIDDSGVFFLRSTRSTPSMVKVILEGPQGSSMSYSIPALKLQDYSMEEMLEKKLFIMLPFLFFNYEKQLEPLIGHDIGGVCPFGINDGVAAYLDESLKRHEIVYPAVGSDHRRSGKHHLKEPVKRTEDKDDRRFAESFERMIQEALSQ